MANYTIRTTRNQEAGLVFAYDTYADKVQYPTKDAYFQSRINVLVSDPMYADRQRAQSTSFEASFETIPEAEQPVAKTEIETVITNHGGTIVPASPPTPMPTTTLPISPEGV